MNAPADRRTRTGQPTRRPAEAGDEQTVTQPDSLRIAVGSARPDVVISLHGDLDVRSAHLIRDLTLGDQSRIFSIVIELSHLSFCDSTGMRALLDLQAEQDALGRDVQIANASPVIGRLAVLIGQEHSRSRQREGAES